MPFIAITVAMRRTDFVNAVISGTKSMSYWCREYGISRPTGYKWLKRYENGESMEDRSHRTFGTPLNKTDPEMEELILKKRKFVYFGIDKQSGTHPEVKQEFVVVLHILCKPNFVFIGYNGTDTRSP